MEGSDRVRVSIKPIIAVWTVENEYFTRPPSTESLAEPKSSSSRFFEKFFKNIRITGKSVGKQRRETFSLQGCDGSMHFRGRVKFMRWPCSFEGMRNIFG